jgi:hypothetical protein
MNVREIVYGALAVIGGVAMWYYTAQYLQTDNVGWIDWIQQCLVNPAAAGALMDLTFGYVLLSFWMIVEGARIGLRHSWIFIAISVFVSFATGVGLFLLFRERHLRRQPAAG